MVGMVDINYKLVQMKNLVDLKNKNLKNEDVNDVGENDEDENENDVDEKKDLMKLNILLML
jgi:hypothetical protein